jgi:hypothetical protein
MGILSNIFSKIFPSNHPANTSPTTSTPGASTGSDASVATGGAVPGAAPGGTTTATGGAPPVDVEQILSAMAAKNAEKLNWQTSIVDLMKLLGLDSSLQHRKELAQELHYSGDMNDSASMNIWLQKQVMQQLAANGGKVPAGLM